MIRVAVYDESTGRIAHCVRCDASAAAAQAAEGQLVDPVADDVRDTTHRMVAGAAVAMAALPDLPSATVAAGVALGGFPSGALVRVVDVALGLTAAEAVLDGTEVAFPYAGAWRVEVLDAFPALPRSYAVTVT